MKMRKITEFVEKSFNIYGNCEELVTISNKSQINDTNFGQITNKWL
jgi:hypothetical protein